MFRFARSQLPSSQDAEDVFQETFRTLFERGRSFIDEADAKRWLFATASNHCKHFYRTAKRKGATPLDPTDPVKWVRGKTTMTIYQGEPYYDSYHDVWDEVNKLSPAPREAMYLYYVEDYSIDEIAEITHSNPTAVRVRLHRARRKLKLAMQERRINGSGTISPGNAFD